MKQVGARLLAMVLIIVNILCLMPIGNITAYATEFNTVKFSYVFDSNGKLTYIDVSFNYTDAGSAVSTGKWGIGIWDRDFYDTSSAKSAAIKNGYSTSVFSGYYDLDKYNPERSAPASWSISKVTTTTTDSLGWSTKPLAYTQGSTSWAKGSGKQSLRVNVSSLSLSSSKTYYLHIFMNNGKCWFIESSGVKGYSGNTFTLASVEAQSPHKHNWVYSQGTGSNTNRLIATCQNCPFGKSTYLTLNASNSVYSGGVKTASYASGQTTTWSSLVGKSAPTIQYYLQGTATKTNSSNSGAASEGSAPVEAGLYTAKATMTYGSNQTASAVKNFEITKADIASATFYEPDAPIAGNRPATTTGVPTGAFYSANVSWTPVSEQYKYSTEYTATVTLVPDKNHKFKDDMLVTTPTGWEQTTDTKDYAYAKTYRSTVDNFNFEELNNIVSEDGQVLKRVKGQSSSENENNADLNVIVPSTDLEIYVYQLSDVAWNTEEEIYESPQWVEPVRDWLEEEEEERFDMPEKLANASKDMIDDFYVKLRQADGVLERLTKVEGMVPEATALLADEDTYLTFENLSFGTWMVLPTDLRYLPVVINIMPQRDQNGYKIISVYTTSLKETGVTINKKINGCEADTVALGDVVSFSIDFDRPTELREDSTVVLTDIMSPSFALASIEEIILSKDAEKEQQLEKGEDYTIKEPSINEDGDAVIEITFTYEQMAALDCEKIYVFYTATVTDQVQYNSESNYNRAILSVDAAELMDTAYAYTYAINIVKLDGSSAQTKEEMNTLPGAEFTLYKEMYVFVGNEYAASRTKLGEYTKEETPAKTLADFAEDERYYVYEIEAESDGSLSIDGATLPYEEGAVISRVFYIVKSGVGINAETGHFYSVASREGITISGLDAGCYVLEESDAPDGYSELAEDMYFEINRMTEEEAKVSTNGSLAAFYEQGKKELNRSGKVSIVVLNYRGLTLPSTGGKGTLLFVIVGCVLMIAPIGIVVYRKRRMERDSL